MQNSVGHARLPPQITAPTRNNCFHHVRYRFACLKDGDKRRCGCLEFLAENNTVVCSQEEIMAVLRTDAEESRHSLVCKLFSAGKRRVSVG